MSNPDQRFEVETWYEDDDKTIAYVALKGIGSRVRNNKCDMTYEIISGDGSFSVAEDFDKPHGTKYTTTVKDGDIVRIPIGWTYQDRGDLVMLATSVPRFDPSAVEVI